MKKLFLSFASKDMASALLRIEKQATAMGIYDQILVWNQSNLDDGFIRRFQDKLNSNVRGFGYWSWKPQVILQALSKMNDGDILQYTDAGCHLNPNGINRLNEYFDIAANTKNGILAFQGRPPIDSPLLYDGRELPDLTEHKWLKGDLFDYFNVRNLIEVTATPTIGAGIIFIKKCDVSISIIQSWLDVFESNFSLADDSPSRSANFPEFIEHRHDQSIFSILCKINQVQTLSAYEYWYPQINSMKPDWHALAKLPIHAKRDKGKGFFKLFFQRLFDKLLRIKAKIGRFIRSK